MGIEAIPEAASALLADLAAFDAALAAMLLHEKCEAGECLRRARVGRMMLERRLDREVDFAAQKSLYDVVPRLDGERLVAA